MNCCVRNGPHQGGVASGMIEMRRAQRSFGDGLIAERPQNTDHRGGDFERPGAAVLRGAWHHVEPGADGSRHRVLWQSRASRRRALPRRRGCRSHADQDQEPTNQRNSASASIAPYSMNSIAWRSARKCIAPSTSCRAISMLGSRRTTKRVHIRDDGAMAKCRCRPSLTHCLLRGRNWCQPCDAGHRIFVGHPPRRSAKRQVKYILLHLKQLMLEGLRQELDEMLPNRSTKSLERKREQRKRWFRNGQKWRTGSEGRISVVKRRHGLDRCRYNKGDLGMNRWVGLGVIADNVVNIGRAMEKQAAP